MVFRRRERAAAGFDGDDRIFRWPTLIRLYRAAGASTAART
jgi:hypothetical protein